THLTPLGEITSEFVQHPLVPRRDVPLNLITICHGSTMRTHRRQPPRGRDHSASMWATASTRLGGGLSLPGGRDHSASRVVVAVRTVRGWGSSGRASRFPWCSRYTGRPSAGSPRGYRGSPTGCTSAQARSAPRWS